MDPQTIRYLSLEKGRRLFNGRRPVPAFTRFGANEIA